MNVMWYVGKFDEATWHVFTLLGLTPSFLREQHRGMAAVHQEITYKRELRAGDVLTIYSRVLEVREKVIRFYHEMHNEETGEVAATTVLTAVHIDAQIRKSCPFPPTVIERAQKMIDAGSDMLPRSKDRGFSVQRRSSCSRSLTGLPGPENI